MKIERIFSIFIIAAIVTTSSSCFLLTMGLVGSLVTTKNSGNQNLYGWAYQNTNDKYEALYKNQLEKNSTILRTWYHYTVEEVNTETYILKRYYPDTKQMTDFYTYSSPNLLIKNGTFEEWWDNGNPKMQGEYNYGQPSGKWSYYDAESGKTTKSGFFRKGVKEGKWSFFYKKNGKTKAEINYSNDQRNGPFKLFNEDDMLIANGLYFKGQIENITWQTEDSAAYQYFLTQDIEGTRGMIQQMPSYEQCDDLEFEQSRIRCTDKKLLAELNSRIKYPSKAEDLSLEGVAIVRFVVDAEGKVTNVNVERGLCKEIKTELERVFEELPRWTAGKLDGKPIDVEYEIAIPFSLQRENVEYPKSEDYKNQD